MEFSNFNDWHISDDESLESSVWSMPTTQTDADSVTFSQYDWTNLDRTSANKHYYSHNKSGDSLGYSEDSEKSFKEKRKMYLLNSKISSSSITPSFYSIDQNQEDADENKYSFSANDQGYLRAKVKTETLGNYLRKAKIRTRSQDSIEYPCLGDYISATSASSASSTHYLRDITTEFNKQTNLDEGQSSSLKKSNFNDSEEDFMLLLEDSVKDSRRKLLVRMFSGLDPGLSTRVLASEDIYEDIEIEIDEGSSESAPSVKADFEEEKVEKNKKHWKWKFKSVKITSWKCLPSKENSDAWLKQLIPKSL
eukprot:CAMPEP_0194305606 /NCGR_PEP_ID=MMETSP0171-20130528/3004_1 /TAXON_ID=218684 /ORGANISM="Corethron pennatum, Strain L29A3" /LENGTH=307 /DNA_ID=CAMNT_0039057181 /DNA_START=219 /DNA_END=1139 /DNA_ORIENTATION=+